MGTRAVRYNGDTALPMQSIAGEFEYSSMEMMGSLERSIPVILA